MKCKYLPLPHFTSPSPHTTRFQLPAMTMNSTVARPDEEVKATQESILPLLPFLLKRLPLTPSPVTYYTHSLKKEQSRIRCIKRRGRGVAECLVQRMNNPGGLQNRLPVNCSRCYANGLELPPALRSGIVVCADVHQDG